MIAIDKTDESRCSWLNIRPIMTDLRNDKNKLRGK